MILKLTFVVVEHPPVPVVLTPQRIREFDDDDGDDELGAESGNHSSFFKAGIFPLFTLDRLRDAFSLLSCKVELET